MVNYWKIRICYRMLGEASSLALYLVGFHGMEKTSQLADRGPSPSLSNLTSSLLIPFKPLKLCHQPLGKGSGPAVLDQCPINLCHGQYPLGRASHKDLIRIQ